eukprot:gene7492-5279_t
MQHAHLRRRLAHKPSMCQMASGPACITTPSNPGVLAPTRVAELVSYSAGAAAAPTETESGDPGGHQSEAETTFTVDDQMDTESWINTLIVNINIILDVPLCEKWSTKNKKRSQSFGSSHTHPEKKKMKNNVIKEEHTRLLLSNMKFEYAKPSKKTNKQTNKKKKLYLFLLLSLVSINAFDFLETTIVYSPPRAIFPCAFTLPDYVERHVSSLETINNTYMPFTPRAPLHATEMFHRPNLEVKPKAPPVSSSRTRISSARATDATLQLLLLCRETDWTPPANEVAAAVKRGADPFFLVPDECATQNGVAVPTFFSGAFVDTLPQKREKTARPRYSIFELLCQRGCVRGARACLGLEDTHHLTSEAAVMLPRFQIDFTVVGRLHAPLLSATYSTAASATTSDLMQNIVDRLDSRVGESDVVDWGQQDPITSDHLVRRAARLQQLSVLWPVLSASLSFQQYMNTAAFSVPSSPTNKRTGGSISLKGGVVWQWDWDALGAEQRFFDLGETPCIRASAPTASLCRLCWQRHPDLAAVQAAVFAGGDVCFADPLSGMPLLHQLIEKGAVPQVCVCLSTTDPIDFSATDDCDRTGLHMLLSGGCAEEDVVRILSMMLNRLENPYTGDKPPEWGARDWLQRDALTIAAEQGLLSTAFMLLKASRERIPSLNSFFRLCATSRPSSSTIPDSRAIHTASRCKKAHGATPQPWDITRPVRRTDWESLSEADRKCFRLQCCIIEG